MSNDTHQLSYLQYVQGLVGNFPRLQLVVDFMSPHIRIKGYHKDVHVTQRMRKVDVKVIDLGPSSAKPTLYQDPNPLSSHLDSEQEPDSTRVILVESISADVIELLGKKFSLDPRFFENHLRGIQEFLADRWEGDKTARLESAMSEVLHRKFLTLRFSRPYFFKGWDDTWALRVKCNVPRIGNRVASLFLHEYASVYGPIQSDKNCSTFIVLCDPLLDNSIPDDLYLRNSEPLPPYNPQSHFTPSSAERKQISTRSVLEIALLRSQTYTCSGTHNLLIHTVLATALDFHAAAIYELSLARYRLNSGYTNRPKESYNTMLNTLNRAGGWVDLHEFVHVSLGDIRNIGLQSLLQGEARQSLEIEVQSLEAAHIKVQRNQVQILEFLRQEQEIHFTRSVGRLTAIAFLFLPFSTVATILSIQDAMRFGVFVGLALPMLVICIVVGIWGASTADIMKAIGDWTRVSWMRCTAYLRELLLSSGIEETVKEPDVESKAESSDELLDLYQKVSAVKAGHDEKRMGILIAEMQSMPSLRRRASGKFYTSST